MYPLMPFEIRNLKLKRLNFLTYIFFYLSKGFRATSFLAFVRFLPWVNSIMFLIRWKLHKHFLACRTIGSWLKNGKAIEYEKAIPLVGPFSTVDAKMNCQAFLCCELFEADLASVFPPIEMVCFVHNENSWIWIKFIISFGVLISKFIIIQWWLYIYLSNYYIGHDRWECQD